MKPIRVLHTVASVERLDSGVTYCVRALARAQAFRGTEVEVFSLGQPDRHASEGVAYQTFGSEAQWLPALRPFGLSFAMARAVKRSNAQILHTHGLWMFPNSLRNRYSKFVITPHGMMTPVALHFSRRKKAVAKLLFQDRTLAAASMLHATSESEYEDIRSYGLRQPVAIIPNGMEVPDESWLAAPDTALPPTVLSLGRIHPKKGLASLIQAWSAVEKDYPHWKLRIVGPDENGHAKELHALVSRLGLDSVSIETPVFGLEKTSLMAKASLFALSTKSENFAMTVGESLAVGVPVISTKGAPWQGLETHRCGWWIDQGPHAMAAALRNAMALPCQERRKMGLRGRAWMQKEFGWDSVAEQLDLAYAWCLGVGEKTESIKN